MWYGLHASPKADPDFVRSATELLESTSRHLILATGSVYLVWHFVALVILPKERGWDVFLITLVVILTWFLAYRLLPRQLLVAQVMWQLGIAGAITLAIHVFKQPEIAFFYALLPLVAAVTVGWLGGLLTEGLVIALVSWLPHISGIRPWPAFYGLGIVAGGAFTGLLGWTAARALLTAVQWYLYGFGQAEEKMEEARQDRAKLARVLEQLDQAYHRLERANHMLVLARAEAEEAQEARNRFALAVSHELRTPLNFIIGFSELMVNSPATYAQLSQWPTGLHDDVQEIYRSSTHLLNLVNDILDLGQIEALRMALIKEWVDPARIVQEVEAMVQQAFARKGLQFRTEVQPDLPDVFVDRTRIRQILLNLVSNSLRFTDRGLVVVRLQRDDESLRFCVQDTGPGIAQQDIPKLFEEFRQVSQASWRRREGSGLGIPISRRFVELHGGRMWVESRIGEGTSIYFTVPLPEAAREQAFPLSDETLDDHYWRYLAEKAASERTLLVLSPDPAAGDVIARYVVDDCGVVAVLSPDQVCPAIAESLPSALILDHTLVTDEEMQSTLRELPYDLPVISFAFPGTPGRPRRLPAGVSSYLVKPIGRRDLVEAIQALGPGVRSLLIVDDDPAMVRFVSMVLKSVEEEESPQGGYQLRSALTGTEALQRLREDKPDAMLLDLALPDISGWRVLKELRHDPDLDAVPVILLTAHDWPQMLGDDEGETLRVAMHRPFSHHELTVVLKCLLETVRPAYPVVSAGPVHPTDLSG